MEPVVVVQNAYKKFGKPGEPAWKKLLPWKRAENGSRPAGFSVSPFRRNQPMWFDLLFVALSLVGVGPATRGADPVLELLPRSAPEILPASV